MNAPALDIEMPAKMAELFDGPARYRVAFGGRGSGKTRTFAKMAAVMAYNFARSGKVGQILCAREHLNSLEESSFTEIRSAIEEDPFLSTQFDIGARYIRTNCKSVDFTFAGLRTNLESIKSKARTCCAGSTRPNLSAILRGAPYYRPSARMSPRSGSVLTHSTRSPAPTSGLLTARPKTPRWPRSISAITRFFLMCWFRRWRTTGPD